MKILLTLLALVFSAALADDLILSPKDPERVSFVGESFVVACLTEIKNAQRLLWLGPDNKQITSQEDSGSSSPTERRLYVDASSSGEKGVDLMNENVHMKDRGNYTCSAQINGREVRKQFMLKVYKKTDFKGTPAEQFLEEGKDSTIKCNADGVPPPTIRWFKDGKVIKTKKSEKYLNHPDNRNWLIVANASINDAGEYTCRSTQTSTEFAELRNFVIDVGVQHKPIGNKKHSNESFSFVSGVVNLTCEAVAEPKANFTWLKDGNVMNDSEIIQIFNSDHKSILEITVNDESMFGDYYCKAQNNLGTLERVVTLEKGRKPAIPEFQILKHESTQFHLKIKSQNHPEMPILSYKVEYRRPGGEWSKAQVEEIKANSEDKYVLKNLKSNTLYSLRASAHNIAGYSDPSPELMERTAKQVTAGSMPLEVSIATILVCVCALLYHQ